MESVKIILGTYKGTVNVIACPPFVDIEVHCYDIDGVDETLLDTDEYGEQYFID